MGSGIGLVTKTPSPVKKEAISEFQTPEKARQTTKNSAIIREIILKKPVSTGLNKLSYFLIADRLL